VAALLGAVAIGGQEAWLAARGFVPTVVDSASTWAHQRARASELGHDALILVGSSRMQLDVDLDELQHLTGRPAVQLAIDGSSFVPILADLAADERVTGTVIVDYQDHVVGDLHLQDGSAAYLSEWHRMESRGSVLNFTTAEKWLDGRMHDHMRSFADGASPFDSLTLRLLDRQATPQYLVTLPDRERRADYSRVAMPQFYYSRAMRNAGINKIPPVTSWQALNEAISAHIAAMPVSDMPAFDGNAGIVSGYVRQIERRGGQVIFVMFPRSGLVRAADEKMFPKERYWSRFLGVVRAPALDYRDVPEMVALICPDGSHLDARDQQTFTKALVTAVPALRDGKMGVANPVAAQDPSEE